MPSKHFQLYSEPGLKFNIILMLQVKSNTEESYSLRGMKTFIRSPVKSRRNRYGKV